LSRERRVEVEGLAEVVLWGFPPETPLTVRAEVDGHALREQRLSTDPLPPPLEALEVEIRGGAPVAEHLMLPLRCGEHSYLSVLDASGQVVWIQALLVDPEAGVGVANLTDDGGLITLLAGGIHEVGFDGQTRLDLRPGLDFDQVIHHDVYKHRGRIYALWADTTEVATERGPREAVVDGFSVWDAGGRPLASWWLADHVALTEEDLTGWERIFWRDVFPGAVDWSHANSVFVDDEAIWISTRWISAVWKVQGLDQPDFGRVAERLTGVPAGAVGSDRRFTSALPDDPVFREQHHARWERERLTVFDNRLPGLESRVLSYDLATPGEARLVEAWTLPRSCEVQGGMFRLPDGSSVATCADAGLIYHLAPGEAVARRTVSVRCGEVGPRTVVPRAQPVLDW
jgi:hypothetical protein